MNRAVFLDRDGVVNELIYYQEHGIIDSPFTVEQFSLISGVGEYINRFHELGYKVVLISNQPGIAKGHLSQKTFEKISGKMKAELAKSGAVLDAEYYCFHHPEAKIDRLRVDCVCRKPKPGLLLQAAKDMNLDLSQSWMIGDGLTDIQAGKGARVKTILVGRIKCELCYLMDEQGARPDAVCSNLTEVAKVIKTKTQQDVE